MAKYKAWKKRGREIHKLGTTLRIGEIKVRGVGQAGKRQLIERWAIENKLDIVCIAETKTPSRGMEGGTGKHIGDEEFGGQFKLYFSTGVKQEDLDEKEKIKKEGKLISTEMRSKTTEQAGRAIIARKNVWHLIEDVRPLGGRIIKMKINTKPNAVIFGVYAPHAAINVL